MKKVGFISLGIPKNLVVSEVTGKLKIYLLLKLYER